MKCTAFQQQLPGQVVSVTGYRTKGVGFNATPDIDFIPIAFWPDSREQLQ